MNLLLNGIPWGIILILLPLTAGILVFLWPRTFRVVGLSQAVLVGLSVLGLGGQLQEFGVYQHRVGGWGAPLGIDLYADGLSLLMLTTTALVSLGISTYAIGYFTEKQAHRFWPIWLILIGSLNALFLSADIFNLYVTLELVGLASVTLVTLAGGTNALGAGMRYLLATLLGSLAYLLGVTLLYHGFGSLDIRILADRVMPSPVMWVALGALTSGLALKTALVPFHFWLPPAHASAPAPVSALLSALVVKGSFYILLRLWLSIFQHTPGSAATILGLLGCAGVLWGSLQAVRQTRVKMLVAYSTVAQIGYLFMAFPLGSLTAWRAAALMTLSHALAKAAMFLAAGNLIRFSGHDRIADLDNVLPRLPITASAFGLAGISIIGLPPSGGFIGKWLMLQAALSQGRWDLVAVLIIGGILAAVYVLKILGSAFAQTDVVHEPGKVHQQMEWAALLLALAAVILGFLAPQILPLLDIGSPFGELVL